MWKCPKCGRTFKNENQSHYCGKAPETIDEYILAQNEAVQPRLREIREIFRAAFPDAEERISWSMPTYWKGRNILHFAASKKHLGLYPGGEATTVFAEELKEYDVSKGMILLSLCLAKAGVRQMDFDREMELENAGIDAFEFSLMDDDERAEFLEGLGLEKTGLDKLIEQHTGITAMIAEESVSCVALGTGKALENVDMLEKLDVRRKIPQY